ncbi:hypothetical protein [Glutamicibacter protophormiae]|uniref:hypothetical protein n=1 Tax=Glutamicibacter protophormiae TaxID=37930 RepID=UPI00195E693B|nr:hypothetical protein [Glutamicibacter protophormiae]QRQ79174.1 hypothetical protein JQN66_02655 [Glutamicibacter protophormiae]
MSGADELRKFAADLGKVAGKAVDDIEPVMKKGAQNIKEDLQSQVEGTSWQGLRNAISYDRIGGIGSLGYEIGPDKGRRGGGLGNLWYFGGSRGGGYGDLEGPLAAETPNLERELGRVVDGWGDALE